MSKDRPVLPPINGTGVSVGVPEPDTQVSPPSMPWFTMRRLPPGSDRKVMLTGGLALVGFLALLAVVATQGTTAWDRSRLDAFVAASTSGGEKFWGVVTGFGAFPNVVAIALLIALTADAALRTRWPIVLRVGLALGLEFVVVGPLKVVTAQRGPMDRTLRGDNSATAFPSGHVSVMCALMTVLVIVSLRYVRATLARSAVVVGAVAAGLMMAWSRVYLGVHWPTDVLAGALIGIVIGCAAHLLADRIEDAIQARGHLRAQRSVEP